MSIKAMAIVWEAELPRPEKFVLLALADHADHEGGHISPSLGRVAWKTGYSYQKVLAIVKSMRKDGILEQVGVSELRTHVYQIRFEKLQPLEPYLGRNALLHGKETRPSDEKQIVKKVDHHDSKETILSKKIVSKVDHPDSKETIPSAALMVKKVDHDGKETLPKPISLKPVNIIKDTPEEKIIIKTLSSELKKIGVTQSVSKRLQENYDLKLISDWLELYVQASELGIARSAGWLVSALDHGWSLDAMRQRIEEERIKRDQTQPTGSLPEHVRKQLPDIGWVGGLEKLEQHYQNDPEEFERWLTYIKKETPNDKYQSGRFLEGLRSGLPAPELRSGQYQAYLANEKYSDEDNEQQEDRVACKYTDCWQVTLNSMGIASRLMNCDIVDHKESGGRIILKMKTNDQQSYYNLQNLKTMKNFHNKAAMVFGRAVELEIEEYTNV